MLVLFPVVGLIQHLVAYGRGFLSPGDFNDEKDFENMDSRIAAHTVLLKEKVTIEDLNTWPWQSTTLRGLLSAILLPVVLSILQNVISGWFGLKPFSLGRLRRPLSTFG